MSAEAAEPTDSTRLPPPVRELIDGAGVPSRHVGLMVQAVDARAKPLAALNAETSFQLASTAKVVTSLAALDLLGPQYRWRTSAYLTGPLHEGRLLGDLVIVGGGNAQLRSADLQEWFARMRAAGLREVWGDIVLDRLAFSLSAQDHASTPEPTPSRPHHARPDALTLDEGALHVTVRSLMGRQPGGAPAAEVSLSPPLAGVSVVKAISGRGCSVWASSNVDGRLPQIVVRGQWGPGCGERELLLSPFTQAEFSARAVEGLWRASGGRLKGRVLDRNRAKPADDALTAAGMAAPRLFMVHQSEPLPALIRDINKSSDNLGARHLMLSLDRGFPDRAATLAGARARLEAWLRHQGLTPGADIALDTGSGLSHDERGKPRALVQLLRQAWVSQQARAFIDSLPVAGIDGTLAHRMTTGAARGMAFLKTGTLLDTRALAGYVRGNSGRTYAVAALVNHPQAQQATPALDALIEWLVRNG